MSELNEVLKLQDKYHDILIKDAGLRTLCDLLTEEINNSVFIFDKFKENVLYLARELRDKDSDFYSYLDQKEFEKKEVVKNKYDIDLERVVYKWKIEEVEELQIKLESEEETFGYLVILEENKLQEQDFLAIRQAVYALTLKLHQNNLIQNLARKCSNELIEDLLQGKIKDKNEIIKRGELAGWDLTVPYQMFIISFKSDATLTKENGERSLYKYELEEKVIHSLHRIIRTTLSTKYITFSYDDDILLLIHYQEQSDEIKSDIKNISEQLSNKFNQLKFSIGAGCFIEDCSQISKSYQQGLYTLDFLAATNQEQRVFFYKELGVLRLLWQLDKEQLADFVDEFLADLLDYDQNNNTNWIETLGVYLKTGGSIQQSANLLPIHPNTMRYRINRIQEILGVDLHDFEVRSNLAIAYKINKFITRIGEGE
ncbi:PucR family transcriptional regulator [Halanaerobacter jeridensis]|uniref:Sugar diacid utilization regulator n=1 Tax=Halanaerobacter jeridensis TaxID=706427 RepID=A0A939BMG3_9FIRM|nr:helix-turn-helix domain-containing protein [Halanaerobacter jeridensis]MBM7556415.1 sugar diacid utilization regulator [Halanaerobacter jeridensis]